MLSRLKKGGRGILISKSESTGCPSCKKAFTREQNSNKLFYSKIKKRFQNAKLHGSSSSNNI